jgi:hypothetical protein
MLVNGSRLSVYSVSQLGALFAITWKMDTKFFHYNTVYEINHTTGDVIDLTEKYPEIVLPVGLAAFVWRLSAVGLGSKVIQTDERTALVRVTSDSQGPLQQATFLLTN